MDNSWETGSSSYNYEFACTRSILYCFFSTAQRNLCLSESIRTDVGSLARVGRHAAPPGLAIQSEWTRVGRQFDPSRSAVLPGKNCRPTRIRADWYWSAKIGSELPIGMPTRPDRQFNAGNPPGSARIGTSFAE